MAKFYLTGVWRVSGRNLFPEMQRNYLVGNCLSTMFCLGIQGVLGELALTLILLWLENQQRGTKNDLRG